MLTRSTKWRLNLQYSCSRFFVCVCNRITIAVQACRERTIYLSKDAALDPGNIGNKGKAVADIISRHVPMPMLNIGKLICRPLYRCISIGSWCIGFFCLNFLNFLNFKWKGLPCIPVYKITVCQVTNYEIQFFTFEDVVNCTQL